MGGRRDGGKRGATRDRGAWETQGDWQNRPARVYEDRVRGFDVVDAPRVHPAANEEHPWRAHSLGLGDLLSDEAKVMRPRVEAPAGKFRPERGDFYTNGVEPSELLGWHNFLRGDLPLRPADMDHPASSIWVSPAGKLNAQQLKKVPRYRISATDQCI